VRRLWRALARRLPDELSLSIMALIWSIPLVVYRVSGRRWARSPDLYRAGILRQQLERARIPGMTTSVERAYFKWHAQEVLTGAGSIVDLGSWLGSTTAALAMGLVANPRPSAAHTVIHAYDQFIWEEPMGYHSPATRLGPYQPGETFRPEFELVVRRWRRRIVVHEGDLLRERWTGGPIELLLVDAMKSWELTGHLMRRFYPCLSAGCGYLIHQDFSHYFTPWIPLTAFRLLDHLEPVKDIPRSESMVFRVRRPLDEEDVDLTRASFGETEIDEAFAYWLGATLPEKHSGLRTARILLAHADGDSERADHLRRSLGERGLLGQDHALKLRAIMDGRA
jgi:hypothetical protein